VTETPLRKNMQLQYIYPKCKTTLI